MTTTDDREHFLSNVEKHRDGCWIWRGARRNGRYGVWRDESAHRAAYRLFVGDLPPTATGGRGPSKDTVCVCHKCDNPPCVNPEHLFLGTMLDNIRDAVRKRRMAHGEGSPNARLTDEQVIEMRRLHHEGLRQVDLAEKYGVTQPSVNAIVNWKTWKHLPREEFATPKIKATPKVGPVRRGAEVRTSKLTEAKVREIRKLREEGWTLVQLASQFGVSAPTIRDVVTRQTWDHVGDEPIDVLDFLGLAAK